MQNRSVFFPFIHRNLLLSPFYSRNSGASINFSTFTDDPLVALESEDMNIPQTVRVGDFVEARRGHFITSGIVVKVFQDDSAKKMMLTLMQPNGNLAAYDVAQVLFHIPNWPIKSNSLQVASNVKLLRVPKVSEWVEQVIENAIKMDTSSLFNRLNSMKIQSQMLRLKTRKELENLYPKCLSAIESAAHSATDMKNKQIYKNVLIELDDLALAAFYQQDLVVDSNYESSDYSIKLTSLASTRKTPSLVESFTIYSYVLGAGSNMYQPFMSKRSDLRKQKLISIRPIHDARVLEWIQTESKGLFFKNFKFQQQDYQLLCKSLGIHCYSPGTCLDAFLKKIAANFKSNSSPLLAPSASITFSNPDLIFIECIKKAAFASPGLSCPYTNFFTDSIQTRLMDLGIIRSESHMQPRTVAASLLKALGVWSPGQFANVEKMIANEHLEVLHGHGHDWIDSIEENAGKWAASLVMSKMSSSNQTVNDTVLSRLEKNIVATNGSTLKNLSSSNSTALHDSLSHIRSEHNSTVFVVDDFDAKELDDGVSIDSDSSGNTWLHVHIADPTAMFSVDHPLSLYSQLRATSVYLPERSYPMLPSILSRELLSLGISSLSLSFSARLNNEGDIVDYKVTPFVLKSVKKIAYDDVDSCLSHEPNLNTALMLPNTIKSLQRQSLLTPTCEIETSDTQLFDSIQKITQRHNQFRIRNGAFIPERSTCNVNVRPYPLPVFDHLHSNIEQMVEPTVYLNPYSASSLVSPSRKMIEECMIIAGRVAAKFCRDHKLPVAYRGQAPLTEYGHGQVTNKFSISRTSHSEFQPKANHELDSLIKKAQENTRLYGFTPFGDFSQLRAFSSPIILDSRPVMHSTMGIPGISPSSLDHSCDSSIMHGYLHVTSPLRRYMDLLTHWQIKSALLNENPVFTSEMVEKIASRQHKILSKTKILSNRASLSWILQWCQSREVIWNAQGQDPIAAGNLQYNERLGIGLPVKRSITNSLLEPSEGIGNAQYECLVTDLGNLENKVNPSCILTDLGGIKASLITTQTCQIKVGDRLACKIVKIDPNFGSLVVTLLE